MTDMNKEFHKCKRLLKDFEKGQLGSIQMQREFINLKNRMFSKGDNLLDI